MMRDMLTFEPGEYALYTEGTIYGRMVALVEVLDRIDGKDSTGKVQEVRYDLRTVESLNGQFQPNFECSAKADYASYCGWRLRGLGDPWPAPYNAKNGVMV